MPHNEWWCPNPSQWLDITIQFAVGTRNRFRECGFACCSQCWATSEAKLGTWSLDKMASPLFGKMLLAVWNSERLQQIRRDWFEGRPSMCRGCPRLNVGSDPPVLRTEVYKDAVWQAWLQEAQTETYPRVISLNYDPSCNLTCPSCRSERLMLGPGDRRFELLQQFQEHTLRPLLRGVQCIHASGYGEPFASRLYRDLLTTLEPHEAPYLTFYFLTNGLGFDKALYEQMPLRHRIRSIAVSIDAATEATYAKVRGGNWGRLQTNLEFMTKLHADGKIGHLEMGFVYQSANWRELRQFVSWAEALGADKIMVYTLLPHGYTGEAYSEQAVGLSSHPDHDAAEAELRRVEEAAQIPLYIERPNPERAGVGNAPLRGGQRS